MEVIITTLIGFEGTVTVKVKVRLTASDWQLYTATMRCDTAAAALNLAASKALSCGDKDQAWAIFTEATDEYWQYGASDSEPRSVFAQLVKHYL